MESTLNNVMYHVRILYPKKEWSEGANTPRDVRLFNTCFNMTLEQISLLVMKIRWVWGDNIKKGWNAKHLLWTLSYLKRYPTYDQLECDIGHDKKTIEKWIMYTVDLIAEIGMVSGVENKNCLTEFVLD